MARKPRMDYEGYIYHVMCRGNNGEYIFSEDSDKKLYLDIVKRYKKKYDFMIYGYCIMDNHVHFIIYRRKDSLAKFMKVIQQTFTQHFNKKYGRKGHVFQQRFKSIPCKEDEYLLQLLYYIHMNPVRAEMEEGIGYRWSSHKIYSKGIKGSIVDTDFIYSMFGNSFKEGIKYYNNYMGTKREFKSNFYKDYSLDQEEVEQAIIKNQRKDTFIELDEIVRMVCYEYGENDVNIISGKGNRKFNSMRNAVIKLAECNDFISGKELREKLGLSSTSISRIRSSEYIIDKYCYEVVEKIKNNYF